MHEPQDAQQYDPTILGLDNVRLDLPLANIGSRTLAASLDHFLLFLLQMIWVTAGLALLPQLGISGGWVAGGVLLGFFLLQWSYFAVFEIVLSGQTPGKMAVGLRVVSARGGRTTASAILIRNFIRTLDVLVGIPIMSIDRRFRRLGDLIAGTLVVHHREDSREEALLGRHPAGWGAQEITVVESFLRRAELMDDDVSAQLAGKLLAWIERTDPAFWAEIEAGLVTDDRVLALRQALEARI